MFFIQEKIFKIEDSTFKKSAIYSMPQHLQQLNATWTNHKQGLYILIGNFAYFIWLLLGYFCIHKTLLI